MRTRRVLLIAAILVCTVAARHRAVVTPPERQPLADVFSASNPRDVESTHLALDLTVDFDAQVLRGSVTHTLLHHDAARQFIVDTNGLDVDGVTADGAAATWTFGTPAANGTPMIIDIAPTTQTVRIDYRTRPAAAGLHWLTAQQTRAGTMPAMWSENEPDMARTWIPLQDTPSARATYDATIHAPAGEMALMSASNNPTSTNATGVYTFSMPHSVPAYLIALTVARYDYRAVGERTGIYSEPNLIDDAVEEMRFLPDMLPAAERIMGAYPFERYDLVFPPKFTGGMENPELNFISQDVITGNHPAIVPPHGIVAHELSHAWFGDRMTCAEWNDVWLNEGFATYYEKRIEEEMGAREQAEFGLAQDHDTLDENLAGHSATDRLTVLHRTFIAGERPAFGPIAYIKGEVFLETMDDRMGRAAFDAAIAHYESRHAFQWVDDVDFKAELPDDPGLQIDNWIYGGGLPSNVAPKPQSALAARVAVQANAFLGGTRASALDTTGWSNIEQQYFLQLIQNITVPRMSELDAAFGFSQMNTPPLLWIVAAAKSLDATSKALLDRLLARGSAASFPVWNTLAQTKSGKAYAVGEFAQVRGFYDPATAKSIASTLGVP
jgi:aminopeptidase N